MYAVPYAGTVPDMSYMNNILTNIGHRFGHRSGLDESSGRTLATFLHGIAFNVYLVFPEIVNNTTFYLIAFKVRAF